MSRYTSKHTGSEIDAAIDRAKAGGAIDTALQNNDPKKWGLGIVLANTQGTVITDFDDILPTGFYYAQSGSLNRPICGAVYAVVINRSYDDVTVFAESPDGVIARRKYKESWGAWEYINPPMLLGVEYRTTERYQGKPVYCKLFNLGSFSAGASIASGTQTEGLDKVIRFEGLLDNTIPLPYLYDSLDNTKTAFLRVSPLAGDPRIVVTVGSNQAGKNVKSTIYYTKSTD